MKFILETLKGIAIGAGAILPGISSGVLCVIFGIYDKLVNSILNFFQDIKKNIKFLLPIIIGMGIGVILFGNILMFLFTNYPTQTKSAFIGLILGSLPVLFGQANNKRGFRLHYLFYLFITLLLAIIMILLENRLQTTLYTTENISFFYLALSGFFMSIGVVVPGVSSSVILMMLGVYDIYLLGVSTLRLSILIPMGIGLILGGFLFLKIIQYCMEHHFSITYYSIIGFVLGSVIILYPGFTFDVTGLISIICLVFGFGIAYLFEKN